MCGLKANFICFKVIKESLNLDKYNYITTPKKLYATHLQLQFTVVDAEVSSKIGYDVTVLN